MEIIFKIIGVGLVTCIAAMMLKPVRSDFAMLVTVVGGVIILVMILSQLSSAINMIKLVASASMCADAGSAGLGDKVLLGGKIVILVMSLPIVTNILSIVMELLPT